MQQMRPADQSNSLQKHQHIRESRAQGKGQGRFPLPVGVSSLRPGKPRQVRDPLPRPGSQAHGMAHSCRRNLRDTDAGHHDAHQGNGRLYPPPCERHGVADGKGAYK